MNIKNDHPAYPLEGKRPLASFQQDGTFKKPFILYNFHNIDVKEH